MSFPFLFFSSFISTRWIGKKKDLYKCALEDRNFHLYFLHLLKISMLNTNTSLHLAANMNLIPPPYLFPVHMTHTYPYVLHVHVILQFAIFQNCFSCASLFGRSFVHPCLCWYAFLLHVSAIPPLNAFHASLICVTIGS